MFWACWGTCSQTRPRKKDFFYMSFVVQEIDQFLSHSWHGNKVWKAVMLILIKNGLHACIFGTFAALVMSLMVFYGLLPVVPRLQVLPEDVEPTSAWSLVTGMLVSTATLLLWKPRQTVFLDNVCIDQKSPFAKAEGIVNVGAFLNRSNSMLVLWDSSYVERQGLTLAFCPSWFLLRAGSQNFSNLKVPYRAVLEQDNQGGISVS